MSSLLKSYTSSSTRSEVSQALTSIVNAIPYTIDDHTRRDLVQVLLNDLKARSLITPPDTALALVALKTLGKQPSGSEIIALPTNLSILLSTLTGDPDILSAALRCVANALLLVEEARTTWVAKDVNGGPFCVDLLQTSTILDHVFLASRILFLCTASESSSAPFLRSVVEGKHNGSTIVDIIAQRLDTLTDHVLARTEMSCEAMTDLLKFTFNLVLHYPKLVSSEVQSLNNDPPHGSDPLKVMGDFWNPVLDGILPPLLIAFIRLPIASPAPLVPPLTHVIHSLITIPISARLHSTWFPDHAASTSHSRDGESIEITCDVLSRAYHILDISLGYYMPGNIEPDDPAVMVLCKKAGDDTLYDSLGPLTLLITRLCLSDETSRGRMMEWLLPANLDRTTSLEGRADLLGRCLRLLASVLHPKMKDAMGEMLFAVCNSDAGKLAAQVGYGNVAGFLFQKGVTHSSPSSLVTPSGRPINPITGVVEDERVLPEMSDEEKELEAEKLFVLFERLERTGAITPEQNLMRKALQGSHQ